MIPDKIYIQENDPSMRYGVNQDADINGMHEYIRKEALLEWANGWLAFKRSGVVLDDGFSYAMEELIKKLNEM